MKHLRLLLSFVVVAACSDVGPQPTAPDLDLPVAAALAQSGIVAKARGAAHRDAFGHPVILNFNASLHEDGSARGSYYFRQVFNGVWIRVDVTCMSTQDDNKAWVAGIISDSSNEPLVGTVSYFYTIDNGEGHTATDIVSLTRANDRPGEDLRFCDEQPTLLPSRDVLHGNVNVDVY